MNTFSLKKTFYCSLICIVPYFLKAQENLIYNGSFENGTGTPPCVNTTSNSSNSDRYSEFDDIIDNWNIANFCVCAFPPAGCGQGCKNPQPRWMDINECPPSTAQSEIHLNRWVFMRDDDDGNGPDYTDAIRSSLKEVLIPGRTYTLRMRLAPGQNYYNVITTVTNHIRIHFSKFSEHWYRNIGNNRWDDAAQFSISNIDLRWQSVECTFIVPIGPRFEELGNIIIAMEDGFIHIDNIELFEVCTQDLLIENKTYYYFNYPISAVNTIVAGTDVNPHTTNGDVLIEPLSNVTFVAGNQINLKPGFHAKTGSNFRAYIGPCLIGTPCFVSARKMENENEDENEDLTQVSSTIIAKENDSNIEKDNFNNQKTIFLINSMEVYPNPSNGKFVIRGSSTNDIIELKIFDMNGRQLFYEKLKEIQNDYRKEIDFKEYSKGVYNVQMSNSDGVIINTKVIIE